MVLLGEPPVRPPGTRSLREGRWPIVADRRPGCGPGTALGDFLVDLLDAGDLDPCPRLVLAACDMPRIQPGDVERLQALGAATGRTAA